MHTNGDAKKEIRLCNAHNRQGDGRCKKRAGWGTDHVGWGNCRTHFGNTPTGKKKAALQEAQAGIPFLGAAIDVDPSEALLAAVQITAGQASYAGQRVAALDPDEDEALHSGWVTFHQQLVDRLARYSTMAISAGVAERMVEAAEAYGDILAPALSAIFDGLVLTEEQKTRAPNVVRAALMMVEESPSSLLDRRPVLDVQKDNRRVTEHLERVRKLTST